MTDQKVVEIVTRAESPAKLRKVSWRITRDMNTRQARLQASQTLVNRAIKEGDLDALDKAQTVMDDALNGLEALVCGLVIELPREWLVEDAPKDIKWSDPKSTSYISQEGFKALLEQIGGVTAEEASKN